MDSLYDINGYQDIAKPSDSMGEDNYTQDVFIQTRPDIFDNGDNPYYLYYNEQNDVTDQEKSDFTHTYNPHQYDKQNTPLVNPYKKIKDIRSKVSSILLRNAQTPKVDKGGYTLYNLLQDTSSFSKWYAPKCTVTKIREHVEKRTWTFNVRGRKEDSKRSGHEVFVRLGRDPKERNLLKLPVHINCTCPFWKYYGPDFNAKSEGYLEGNPLSDGSSPDYNDKGRQNKICKHVYAVGNVFDRFVKDHDLDTFQDVTSIIETLDKIIDPVKMNDISALKEILLLNGSEIKILDKVINKYKKENNRYKRHIRKKEALKVIEDILLNKDGKTLKNIITGLKSISVKKEEVFNKKSSLANVIDLYLKGDI